MPAWISQSDHQGQIDRILAQFDPISLDRLQDAALMDRVDTKYVIGLNQLFGILPRVAAQYRALTINNIRLHAYETLYFDTSAFGLYMQHHNGISTRYKVRTRRYVGTNTSFFEIKQRTNQSRTIKYRLPIGDADTDIQGELADFTIAHARCTAESLEPKLWNDYLRVTLVNKDYPERVTLDFDLVYHWDMACESLPGIVIVEVKQVRRSQPSQFTSEMRQLGIHPLSYSKYAAGVYTLYRGVKANNFKQQMRMVCKAMQGVVHECGY